MSKEIAKVIKITGSTFDVLLNDEIINVKARGVIKQDTKILVGDNVELALAENNEKVIDDICPRKNSLVRPYIANLDQLIIVVSPIPKPDLSLVDKLLIGCLIYDIEPVLVINKADIAKNDFLNNIKEQFGKVIDNIIITSTTHNTGIDQLKNVLKNKLSAFCGQSAVGKTSLINVIFGNLNLKTDGVSKKIQIGKNTTRSTQIFKFDDNTLIADTPGFNMLHFENIEHTELKKYFIEFAKYENCQFTDCNHINTDINKCAVLQALQKGKINAERYNRYKELYLKLYDIWRKKYD